MEIIVISPPEALENEANLIITALEAGAHRLHIRKPSWDRKKTQNLIEAIPAAFRERLSLHDHFDLAVEMGVGGVQVNGRNPKAPEGFAGKISASCHSLAELDQDLDYKTLSPIYDSISKEGYGANFSGAELDETRKNGTINHTTIALGGVTPEHIPALEALGFGGVALLGYVWQDASVQGVKSRVEKAAKMARMCSNFALQFITHNNGVLNELEGARAALEGGCRWVQLRSKNSTDTEFLDMAAALKPECQAKDAIFLLNDKAHLVDECGADGVHLGKSDMAPSKARELLGERVIIGGTANTTDDIDYLVAQGVDYIGLGPFRFTSTKEKLSPVLGLEGYRAAAKHCRDRGYTVPIVAIGGITVDDIAPILDCGPRGIALSGTILGAEDSVDKTRQIMKLLR